VPRIRDVEAGDVFRTALSLGIVTGYGVLAAYVLSLEGMTFRFKTSLACPMCQIGPAISRAAAQPRLSVAPDTWGNTIERLVRMHPGVSVFSVWTAIILLVAMVTGSAWATFFATAMIVATMLLIFRPSFDQLARRLEAAGAIAGFGGLLCFALFPRGHDQRQRPCNPLYGCCTHCLRTVRPTYPSVMLDQRRAS
jgi:hypothetical protein